MMRSPVERFWRGKRKIVIGIDIGTTQSAIAYSYLYPHGEQHVKRVNRWPGQASHMNETKIPSVVWYDSSLHPQKFCAEARSEEVAEEADDQGWKLVEFFKLHLHPESMRAGNKIKAPPLPEGLSVEKIYGDFLRYLLQQTEAFFKDTEVGGTSLWNDLRDSMDFVLAHPNGWGLNEQVILRRATVDAGLVSSLKESEDRVQFLSEAEASVHFVLFNAKFQGNFQPGTEFVVCDAGGSTIDTTLYAVDATEPQLHLREKKGSACVQAGAIYVNERARSYFRSEFEKADFEGDELEDYVSKAVSSFENEAKRSFRDASEDKGVVVGPHRFTIIDIGVKRGRMALTGSQIESFFKPSVSIILESIKKQIEGERPKYCLVVGGFGESPYLRKRLQEELEPNDIQVVLADDSTVKAVSDGTIIWYLKHCVIARATRFAFGTDTMKRATYDVPDERLLKEPDGNYVDGCWKELVPAGFVMNEAEERCVNFQIMCTSPRDLQNIGCKLYAYESEDTDTPEWLLNPDGTVRPGFRQVCTVSANLSGLQHVFKKKIPSGEVWDVSLQVLIRFGSTSLKANVIWEENGVEHRGPASLILPDVAE